VAAIVVVVLTSAVCGFFVYVLVQFRREEKHPRRHDKMLTGFPIVASGQIVGPLADPKKRRLGNAARDKNPGGSSKRRDLL
jgi:heme/copper-type cytochrome/quinol oxidase subunit 2